MLLKVKRGIIIWLNLSLLLSFCLVGCSKQSLKTGTVFLVVPSQTDTMNMSDIQSSIENHLHADGISKPVVQIWGTNSYLIEIPSIKDFNQLFSNIGQQLQLTCVDQSVFSGNPMTIKTGSAIVYQADLTKKDPSQTDAQVITAVQSKIESRLHAYGISNPVVQIWGNNRILIEIPPVKDANQVINVIGAVALLEFKEQQVDTRGNVVNDANGQPVWIPATALGSDGKTQEALTGAYLKPNAYVETDSSSKPEVAFEFNTEGAKLFSDITQRLLNKPLGIFLDGTLISAPTVEAVIMDKGVINGVTLDEAKMLVLELNSGSMDAPLTIIMQNNF